MFINLFASVSVLMNSAKCVTFAPETSKSTRDHVVPSVRDGGPVATEQTPKAAQESAAKRKAAGQSGVVGRINLTNIR